MPFPLDLLLLVVLPYAAIVVCVVGTIERYRRHSFSVTSLSSQFFENRRHFWGIMPFHLGILAVLAAHVAWFLFPSLVLRWNARPVRLYAAEVALLACGIAALLGFLVVGFRRGADARLQRVTSAWDWCVYALLVAQIALGVAVALRHTWGSSWFAAAVAPYLWSLVRLNPDTTAAATLPLLAKAHVVLAYLLVAIFPFSRLVHVLAVPNPYLWRRPQVVRWPPPSRVRATARQAPADETARQAGHHVGA
ncbi:MAG: respiratory nitrate reductase subunit gamma [Acidobacteria bacterium RIFCSPLOWO2_02_FULL_67_36]|nr:MAG: respiratory nitrate reductase subunit gamma [Acidobacteria bacterium RIFCSPLOWO2_02_FULL_67_36]OFW24937.1 MAG: respiratory nitrate reductase subunit gamma [Acidobacteria bacterium RIFCSPLOWO2_12_FULL_66_21]